MSEGMDGVLVPSSRRALPCASLHLSCLFGHPRPTGTVRTALTERIKRRVYGFLCQQTGTQTPCQKGGWRGFIAAGLEGGGQKELGMGASIGASLSIIASGGGMKAWAWVELGKFLGTRPVAPIEGLRERNVVQREGGISTLISDPPVGAWHQGCTRREGASDEAPEAVRQVGGGCQSG